MTISSMLAAHGITEQRKRREGLYRIHYSHSLEDDVRVREIGGTGEMTIAEPLYRARGYAPPFDDLPWETSYRSA